MCDPYTLSSFLYSSASLYVIPYRSFADFLHLSPYRRVSKMSPAPIYPMMAAIVFVQPVPIALMHGNAPAEAPAAKVYLTKLLIAI